MPRHADTPMMPLRRRHDYFRHYAIGYAACRHAATALRCRYAFSLLITLCHSLLVYY